MNYSLEHFKVTCRVLIVINPGAAAEVGELQVAVAGEEGVGRLHVQVDQVVGVQVSQSASQLACVPAERDHHHFASHFV